MEAVISWLPFYHVVILLQFYIYSCLLLFLVRYFKKPKTNETNLLSLLFSLFYYFTRNPHLTYKLLGTLDPQLASLVPFLLILNSA